MRETLKYFVVLMSSRKKKQSWKNDLGNFSSLPNIILMPERKAWSPEEDQVLKYLREEQKISKWSSIAKKMAEEHSMLGRTGKQCRERYHNHLDSTILRTDWTPEEEEQLYSLHDQIGNKWAIIAQRLPGRTDNCVKNHFYSKMRKALRKLNKVIHQNFKKEIKEIKMNVLYKIVEATDEKFKNNPTVDEEISERCCKLKNMLLEYSNDQRNTFEDDLKKLAELALEIHEFSSRYRRKTKRSRRSSVQYPDILGVSKFQSRPLVASEKGSEDEDDSEYSLVFSHHESFEMEEKKPLDFIKEEDDPKQHINELEPFEKPPHNPFKNETVFKSSIIVQEDRKKVQNILKHEGLLQMEEELGKPPVLGDRISEKSDSGLEQQEKSHNMLSESVERMRLQDFSLDGEELDEDNKLFVST